MSGYLITDSGADARKLRDEYPDLIRYTASLENGQGFLAYEDDLAIQADLLVAQDDALIPWPFHAAPKRGVSNGLECFTLIDHSDKMVQFLSEQVSVTGVAIVSGNRLLVESDGRLTAGLWGSAVIPNSVRQYWTVREEASV